MEVLIYFMMSIVDNLLISLENSPIFWL